VANTLTAPSETAGRSVELPTTNAPLRRKRLEYLDTLKAALIVLVIAHHAGQSFGPTGGAWPLYNEDRAPILDKFFTVNAAFFMGLFFLVSAYLLPASYEHKGPRRYLKERFARLGTPLAVFLAGALLYEFVQTVTVQGGSPLTAVANAWSSMVADQHFMHLWFLDQLLIYSTLYVGWRVLTAHHSSMQPRPVPGNSAIVVGLTGLCTAGGLPVNASGRIR
jgi:fucose 4-O-acetylase-like acetyltransferase